VGAMILHMNPPIAVEEKNTFSSKIQAQLQENDANVQCIVVLFFLCSRIELKISSTSSSVT
jgi:hypothetical protein